MIRPANPLSTSLCRYQRFGTRHDRRRLQSGDVHVHVRVRIEQRQHLVEARPARVHDEKAKPFVPKQRAFKQQRVAGRHAELR